MWDNLITNKVSINLNVFSAGMKNGIVSKGRSWNVVTPEKWGWGEWNTNILQ